MKYFLFISYICNLKHNSIYNSLNDLYESLLQLIEEEKLELSTENIPSLKALQNHLERQEDYLGHLSNGTWYHVQLNPVFGSFIL